MNFNIGNLNIIWDDSNYSLCLDEYMKKFIGFNNSDPTIAFKTKYINLGNIIDGEPIEKNGLYEMYLIKKKKFIVYHWASIRFAFGFWIDDLKNDEITYYFNPKLNDEISIDAVRFFSCSGLHYKLLKNNLLIFHSAYVNWNNQALLFCGKSGIGKSTQAKLWNEFNKTDIINGDRCLISIENNISKAHGFPCCGSSLICENKTLPIKAIILLEQGLENDVLNLSIAQKVVALLSGSERYLWSKEELDDTLKIVNEIVTNVPIVKYVCRPDKSSVDYLFNYLNGGLNV